MPRACQHTGLLPSHTSHGPHGCRQWQSQGQVPQSSSLSPRGEDWEREQASHKAGLAALRAEKEALGAQNSQTWQLLEEQTSEIHRLQVPSTAHACWCHGPVMLKGIIPFRAGVHQAQIRTLQLV